jgi:hypothetical protein
MSDKDKHEDEAIETLQSMLKAKKEDDNGEEKEDQEFMGKVKKYLKENPKCMEDLGYVKKAQEKFEAMGKETQSEADNLEADAIIVEGTEFIKSFVELGQSLLKAYEATNAKIESLEQDIIFNTDLNKASSAVILKAKEQIDAIGKTPQPTKSALGQENPTIPEKPDDTPLLVKAKAIGIGKGKELLMKAVYNGNTEAQNMVTQLESCAGVLERIPEQTLKLITVLDEAEGGKK